VQHQGASHPREDQSSFAAGDHPGPDDKAVHAAFQHAKSTNLLSDDDGGGNRAAKGGSAAAL